MELLEFLKNKVNTTSGRDAFRYRRDLFKVLIMSYPAGTPIPMPEIRRTLNFSGGSSAWSLAGRMIKSGDISKSVVRGKTVFTVIKPPKLYEKERNVPVQALPAPEPALEPEYEPEETQLEDSLAERTWTFNELEVQAIRYKFYEPAGSLQDFLRWIR